MIQTLIAASSAVTTIVTVSCTDINTLVDRAKVYPDLSVEERQEIIDLYYDFGEKYGLDCRGRKSRLKERGKNPYYFGESQWQKSPIEVSLTTPMTRNLVRKKQLY